MSNQNEFKELRTDIKQMSESINALTVSIAQLLEGYKHHKEVTEKQGEEIKAVSSEVKILDDKIDGFLLSYKPFLDEAIKDKEKKSDRTARAVMGYITSILLAITFFIAGLASDFMRAPKELNKTEQRQSTN